LLDELPDHDALDLSDEQKKALKSTLEARLSAALPMRKEKSVDKRLERLKSDHEEIIRNKLPLHVNPIEIHPEEMPMRTLQFTERLGYKKENAIRMITSGCYSTLWTVHDYLTTKSKSGLDEHDQSALDMARKWMGLEEDMIPADKTALQKAWRCQRTQCVFHANHCRHGATYGS
jgi:hypothetical protein